MIPNDWMVVLASSSMDLLLFPVGIILPFGTWMSKPTEPNVAGIESRKFC